VAYYLIPQGSTVELNVPRSNKGGSQLYTLVRVQKVVATDPTALNAAQIPVAQLPQYAEMSCQPDPTNTFLVFNSPADLANGQRSISLFTAYPFGYGSSPLLSNVLSVEVEVICRNDNGTRSVVTGNPNQAWSFDTNQAASPGFTVLALQMTLRVWDPATQQTRQVTLFQNM
jgi:hypothetical protein